MATPMGFQWSTSDALGSSSALSGMTMNVAPVIGNGGEILKNLMEPVANGGAGFAPVSRFLVRDRSVSSDGEFLTASAVPNGSLLGLSTPILVVGLLAGLFGAIVYFRRKG